MSLNFLSEKKDLPNFVHYFILDLMNKSRLSYNNQCQNEICKSNLFLKKLFYFFQSIEIM